VNRQRLLRIFILTDVFSMVAGVIAAIIFEGTLPEPLRTYAATQELHPFLLIVGLILLVLLIVAWIGLWRSASWAPAVYAVTWIGCVVIVPFSGPYVGTGIEEMFDFVGTAAGGGILAMLLLAMEERRSSGRATLPGIDTTSGALNDPRRPDRSDELMQPHVKSWRVHRVLSWLYGLIALMLLALPFVARTGEEGLLPAEMAIAFSFPLFFFVLALFHHFVSRGAKERKRWARIGSIILACLLLPGVPVGTIIGVYLLRNSSWESGSAVASGG
jgi:hypothetical protein